MSFLKLSALLFFLLVSFQSKSQVIQQSGSIYTEMAATISSMPIDSGNHYVAPAASQLTSWNIVLNNLILGNYSFSASTASSLGYQLVQFTDTFLVPNRTFYILRNYGSNFWGTYVYYPNYKRPLVIQSPHAKKDANTGHQGIYVFRQTESMLYMLTGTHRCNSSVSSSCSGTTTGCSATSQPYPISDMAHDVNSIFQKTTEVFLNSFSNTHFIQLHGFTKQTTDPYVILSNGTQVTPSPDYMGTFKNMLFNEDSVLTFKVAHLDLSWTRLRGFWNTQSRLVNNSPNPCNTSATNSQGRFFHVEQERIRLRNTVSGWAKISNALINTFIVTPLPIKLTNFKANWQEENVNLKWTTLSEHNASYFQIERSLDGQSFNPIENIDSKGTNNITTNYSYLDKSASLLSNNKIYYRLRQFDVDGHNTLSNTITLNRKSIHALHVFPNPAKDKIRVHTSYKNLEYEIHSLLGKQIQSGTLNKEKPIIDISALPNNMYLLRMSGEVVRFIKK